MPQPTMSDEELLSMIEFILLEVISLREEFRARIEKRKEIDECLRN